MDDAGVGGERERGEAGDLKEERPLGRARVAQLEEAEGRAVQARPHVLRPLARPGLDAALGQEIVGRGGGSDHGRERQRGGEQGRARVGIEVREQRDAQGAPPLPPCRALLEQPTVTAVTAVMVTSSMDA